MTIDELIAVLMAFKAGANIQCRPLNGASSWFDLQKGRDFSVANLAFYEFRVKPEPLEPLEIWVNQFNGTFESRGSYYLTRDIALKEGAGFLAGRVTPVLFREVIDES